MYWLFGIVVVYVSADSEICKKKKRIISYHVKLHFTTYTCLVVESFYIRLKSFQLIPHDVLGISYLNCSIDKDIQKQILLFRLS